MENKKTTITTLDAEQFFAEKYAEERKDLEAQLDAKEITEAEIVVNARNAAICKCAIVMILIKNHPAYKFAEFDREFSHLIQAGGFSICSKMHGFLIECHDIDTHAFDYASPYTMNPFISKLNGSENKPDAITSLVKELGDRLPTPSIIKNAMKNIFPATKNPSSSNNSASLKKEIIKNIKNIKDLKILGYVKNLLLQISAGTFTCPEIPESPKVSSRNIGDTGTYCWCWKP